MYDPMGIREFALLLAKLALLTLDKIINLMHIYGVPAYGNPNLRKKYDAFQIVDKSGQEPLLNAIACALAMRSSAKYLEDALEHAEPEDRAELALALARCKPDEFHAWIKVAEFIYAKPKQSLELTGQVTLEQALAASWKPQEVIEA